MLTLLAGANVIKAFERQDMYLERLRKAVDRQGVSERSTSVADRAESSGCIGEQSLALCASADPQLTLQQ